MFRFMYQSESACILFIITRNCCLIVTYVYVQKSFFKLDFQVIQMNKLPLVVSFIASHNCNTGHILSLESKIDPILSSLKNAVVEA